MGCGGKGDWSGKLEIKGSCDKDSQQVEVWADQGQQEWDGTQGSDARRPPAGLLLMRRPCNLVVSTSSGFSKTLVLASGMRQSL